MNFYLLFGLCFINLIQGKHLLVDVEDQENIKIETNMEQLDSNTKPGCSIICRISPDCRCDGKSKPSLIKPKGPTPNCIRRLHSCSSFPHLCCEGLDCYHGNCEWLDGVGHGRKLP